MSVIAEYLADKEELALKVGVPADDPNLLLALKRASNRFEAVVNYSIRLITNDTIYLSGNGSKTLLLPARNTIGDPVIKINGTPITDFQISRDAGILQRHALWPEGLDNVEVTYTHGWAVIPGGIQDAVLEQAETQYRTIVAYQSRSAGSESVTYSALAAIGATQRWTDMVKKYALEGDTA